jgi:hypothetical protein
MLARYGSYSNNETLTNGIPRSNALRWFGYACRDTLRGLGQLNERDPWTKVAVFRDLKAHALNVTVRSLFFDSNDQLDEPLRPLAFIFPQLVYNVREVL